MLQSEVYIHILSAVASGYLANPNNVKPPRHIQVAEIIRIAQDLYDHTRGKLSNKEIDWDKVPPLKVDEEISYQSSHLGAIA